MKKHLLTLTASLATLGSLASPAKAGDRGDKVAAAVGGFIGGVLVGSAFERDRGPRVVHAPPPPVCPPPVVVCPPPPPPSGYWRDVSDRVWVPARWVVTYDCGRPVRNYVPGYYDVRTRRVWVDTCAPVHGGYAYAGRR